MAKIIQLSPVYTDYYSPLFAHPRYEVWIPVVGHELTHRVSSYGRVMSLKRKWEVKNIVMKPQRRTGGYAGLDKLRPQSIHRIVAIAFLLNPDNKAQVNHKNGIKNDNRLVNLEWSTRSENMLHAYRELGIVSGAKGRVVSAEERKRVSEKAKQRYAIINNSKTLNDGK